MRCRRPRSAPAAQQREPRVEAGGHLGRAHHPQLGGGQLDRERQPVQATADLDDGRGVRPVEREAGGCGGGPVEQQVHRRHPGDGVRVGRRGWRDREGSERAQVLPGDAEGLAARRQHGHARAAAADRLDRLGRGLDEVFAVVEHQQQPLGAQELHQPAGPVEPRPLADGQRGADRVDDRGRVADRRELDEPRAVGEPGGRGARRVQRQHRLPDPADPDDGHDPGVAHGGHEVLGITLAPDQDGAVGRQVARDRRVRTGLRGRFQLRVLTKDLPVQMLHGRGRRHPQLVRQAFPVAAVDLQRVGLAPRPVPGEHQLGVRTVPQRVLGDELLRAGGRLGDPTEREVGVHPVLGRGDPQLLEPDRLRPREVVVGELGVGTSVPEGEGPVQQLGRLGRTRVPRPAGQLGEAVRVECGVGHDQQVAGRAGQQLSRGQRAPQPRDQAVQRRGRVGREPVAPQHLGDPVGGDDRTAVHEQHGEQTAQGRRAHRDDLAPAVGLLDGTENAEPDGGALGSGLDHDAP
ncbi:hypothetical protein BJF90_18340 [Pseudonocardia sp. CNS-004]|nr:hypothetical protein BJF90_18340 [Pseudonocardia sp. CNS-004]